MAGAEQPVDELLLPFLQAADEEASQQFLAQLISRHAEPIIQSITRHKFHAAPERASANLQGMDAEDVHAEILLHLLSRLIDLKKDPGSNPITNFRSYVAVISYNACHKHLRQKYPKRHSLKNRLRYLFSHEQVFLIWEGAGSKQYCGMANWGKQQKPAAARRVEQLRQGEIMRERMGVSGLEYASQANLVSLATAILKLAGGPVELDDLVNIIADLEGIKEVMVRFDEGEQESGYLNELVDTRAPIEAELARRAYLERLWAEIQDLPQRQRVALLLNLRDATGGDCTCLFVVAGVATMRQIAQTLGVAAERLAELWNDLPLEDAKIAQILSVTRQQVINLRKCARERLARRLKAFEEAR